MFKTTTSSTAFKLSFDPEFPALAFGPGRLMLLDREVAAFCAAENTLEKNPVLDGGSVKVPPGVLTSSGAGVKGREIS